MTLRHTEKYVSDKREMISGGCCADIHVFECPDCEIVAIHSHKWSTRVKLEVATCPQPGRECCDQIEFINNKIFLELSCPFFIFTVLVDAWIRINTHVYQPI